MKTDFAEIELNGLPVSSGIGIGTAHVRQIIEVKIPQYRIQAADVDLELKRFDEALVKSKAQLDKLQKKSKILPEMASEEIGYLLDAHAQILSSHRMVGGVTGIIEGELLNAETALKQTVDKIVDSFGDLQDEFVAHHVNEIREVAQRLMRNLTQVKYVSFKDLQPGTVIVADDLTPADTAGMDPTKVVGFATMLGGSESHTSILARSMGMPAVVGIGSLLETIRNGYGLIIDGDLGKVIVNPSEETVAKYEQKQKQQTTTSAEQNAIKALPNQTACGQKIKLMANIESARDYGHAKTYGAEGVGLFRTEFKVMNHLSNPTEIEQAKMITEVIEALNGDMLSVRAFDFGGDKPAAFLEQDLFGALNPSLGLRAIRLLLKRRELLDAQLGAMLRAAAHGPMKIILPMVSNVDQILQVREALQEKYKQLKADGVPVPKNLPPVGIMIEIPAVAMAADIFAKHVDFFSVGTNDLTMYGLAVDRTDEQVSHIFNPCNPGLLRMIKYSQDAATDAGIALSVCGEMAGNPKYTALLLGMGVRELSMSAISLGRVKQRLQLIDMQEAEALASKALDGLRSAEIADLIDAFNQRLVGA